MSKKSFFSKAFRIIIDLFAAIFIIMSFNNISTPTGIQFKILLLCTVSCIVIGVMVIPASKGNVDLIDAIVVFIFMYLGRGFATIFTLFYLIPIQFIETSLLGRKRMQGKFFFNIGMFIITTYLAATIVDGISSSLGFSRDINEDMLISIGTISIMPIVLTMLLYVVIFLIINILIFKIDYFFENNILHTFNLKGLKLIFLDFFLSSIIGSTLYIIENISGVLGTALILILLIVCNYGLYISTKLEIRNEAISGLVKITSDIVKYGEFRDKSISLIKNLKEFIPYNVCAFYIFDMHSAAVTYPIAYTGSKDIDIGELGVDLSTDALTIRKIREGRIYISKDIKKDKEIAIYGKLSSVCISMVLVPIVVHKKANGLILIGGNDELTDFMSNGTEEILSILSNQLSLAIENNMTYKEINDKAYIDELSKLYNRRTFEKEINKLINEGRVFSLVMYDIDNFKQINDTYGHLAGDEVIKIISSTIIRCIRRTDIACRYGGEEIAVIFKGLSKEDAFIISERIRNSIQNTIIAFKDEEIKVTVSGGLAAYPQDAKSRDEIIKKADEILYKECKQKGKNKVCIYG